MSNDPIHARIEIAVKEMEDIDGLKAKLVAAREAARASAPALLELARTIEDLTNGGFVNLINEEPGAAP